MILFTWFRFFYAFYFDGFYDNTTSKHCIVNALSNPTEINVHILHVCAPPLNCRCLSLVVLCFNSLVSFLFSCLISFKIDNSLIYLSSIPHIWPDYVIFVYKHFPQQMLASAKIMPWVVFLPTPISCLDTVLQTYFEPNWSFQHTSHTKHAWFNLHYCLWQSH